MAEWQLEDSDLKKYPHFDQTISAKEAIELATDAERVAKHAFYPFMRYHKRWNRFAEKGARGTPKERPIRYAARRDAYIYAYYRHLLSERYEAELSRVGLGESVLAYRRIAAAGEGGGKCNIHFARDAFGRVRDLGDCCVVALDISSYFESVDHDRLKALWCRLLGVAKLPPDHYQVFKAITSYAVVDKQEVYERLGHFGIKRASKSGKPIRGYLTPYKQVPKQLCTGAEFRKKIAGGSKNLIEKNRRPYGIPQGAPISDLLANLYLIDFDAEVSSWVSAAGGFYYRYSDDILIIAPGGATAGLELMSRAQALIRTFGAKLIIKAEKSSVFAFESVGNAQACRLVHGTLGRNGLEYLGFRYDGRRVYLRDSTLANFYRKVTGAARRHAIRIALRYPNKNASQLCATFNYELLVKQFGRVEAFGEQQQEYRSWTFWTYARRAAAVFGPIGAPILRQLKDHRAIVRAKADKAIVRAVVWRDKRKA